MVDTGIALRMLHRGDPQHALARAAIRELARRQEQLSVTLQVLTEFWNVSTRPASARGGYGLSTAETYRRLRLITRHLRFLPDTVAVRDHWLQLVVAHGVLGVQVHDARIVASMLAHGLTHLLTFNVQDYHRYDEITAIHPQAVVDGRA
jgi:predicted nucleic acid-binding protein